MKMLRNGNEFVEIPRDQYDELNEAVKEMGTPFHSAEQFIISQVNEVLGKFDEYKKRKR